MLARCNYFQLKNHYLPFVTLFSVHLYGKTKEGVPLVITDRFSKMQKGYGPPEVLIAENGGYFTSKFYQDVCRILSIKNNFTTTYHPQKNGQVYRYTRTIIAALRMYVADNPRDWDLYTDALTLEYNRQQHT